MKNTLRVFASVLSILLMALLLSAQAGLANDAKLASVDAKLAAAYEKEVELGKDAVKDIEKDCKLIKDEAVVARVQKIGDKLVKAALSEEVPAAYGDSTVANFTYTFKVIDDKSVNAFCLPGGFIYVHKGLLDFVQSDHELAAVLAHEIAHAAHHHIKSLMREQSKLHSRLALVLLAGLIGNIPQTDLGNVLLGSQFYKIAKLSGYGQQAEADADATAIHYMVKTDYSPVGMLTFLERLAKNPELVQLGIFQTHPHVNSRVQFVQSSLTERGIKLDRRKVVKAAKAETRQVDVDGRKVCEVLVAGKPVIKLTGDGPRAESLCTRLNKLLDTNIGLRDVRTPDEKGIVLVKNEVLIQVSPGDAELNGLNQSETARKLTESLRRVLWQEMIDFIR